MSQLTPSLVRSFNPGTTVFIATGRHTVKAELTGELARDSYYISDMQGFAEFCLREGYDLAGKFAPIVGEPCGCFEDFVCKTHRQEREYYDIALAEGDYETLSRDYDLVMERNLIGPADGTMTGVLVTLKTKDVLFSTVEDKTVVDCRLYTELAQAEADAFAYAKRYQGETYIIRE